MNEVCVCVWGGGELQTNYCTGHHQEEGRGEEAQRSLQISGKRNRQKLWDLRRTHLYRKEDK
jgi:hypothetical protein